MNFKTPFFVFTLMSSSITPAFSQTKAPEYLMNYADFNDGTCAQMVPQLVSDPDYNIVLKGHPLSPEKICACSRKVILEDETLRKQFSGKAEVVQQRLKGGNLRPYLLVRSTQAAFQCIAEEMSRSLKYVELEQ